MLPYGIWRTLMAMGFVLVLGCASSLFAMDKATVKSSSVKIYSERSTQSNPAGTLKKGDVVNIDLQLSSPEGAWCMVRAGARTGYVKCDELVRQPRGSKNARVRPATRTLYNETCGNGNGDTWRERYNLTPAQLAAGQVLADRLGVLKCGQKAARFQQAFHAVGITAQTMDALKTEWWERESIDRCNVQLELFLQQLQNSVNPEQKAFLENDRKEVHRLGMTGQMPLFCAY